MSTPKRRKSSIKRNSDRLPAGNDLRTKWSYDDCWMSFCQIQFSWAGIDSPTGTAFSVVWWGSRITTCFSCRLRFENSQIRRILDVSYGSNGQISSLGELIWGNCQSTPERKNPNAALCATPTKHFHDPWMHSEGHNVAGKNCTKEGNPINSISGTLNESKL